MKAKKMYRIELLENNAILNEIVIMASLSNGGQYLSLTDLESVAKANYIRYGGAGKDVSVNIIGGNVLTIDRGTENLLVLTEVEIMDLQPELSNQEAKDILNEAPTLNRYKGTGIGDNTKHENLN